MKASDIGMSVLYPIKNYLTALPIKSFEYMACSLPMVVSNFDYWQKLFGECALFADPYNPKDIANKILYLYILKKIIINMKTSALRKKNKKTREQKLQEKLNTLNKETRFEKAGKIIGRAENKIDRKTKEKKTVHVTLNYVRLDSERIHRQPLSGVQSHQNKNSHFLKKKKKKN